MLAVDVALNVEPHHPPAFGELLVLALVQKYKQEGPAFVPLALRDCVLSNRIAVSPMCQIGRASCRERVSSPV